MLALSGKPYNYQLCLRSPSLPLYEPNRETHSSNDGLGEKTCTRRSSNP